MKAKTKLKLHINAVCKATVCLSDLRDNDDFLDDMYTLKVAYKKLLKAQKEQYLYPSAPPERWNAMTEEIQAKRRLISEICRLWNIIVSYHKNNSVEVQKFDMPCTLTRKGNTLNALLGWT